MRQLNREGFVYGMTTVSIQEPNNLTVPEQLGGTANHGKEPCPVCGQVGAVEWVKGPDRFHGRHLEYTLVRCPTCSLVWLSDPPKPSELHLHYTRAYDKLISASGQELASSVAGSEGGAQTAQGLWGTPGYGLQFGRFLEIDEE